MGRTPVEGAFGGPWWDETPKQFYSNRKAFHVKEIRAESRRIARKFQFLRRHDFYPRGASAIRVDSGSSASDVLKFEANPSLLIETDLGWPA